MGWIQDLLARPAVAHWLRAIDRFLVRMGFALAAGLTDGRVWVAHPAAQGLNFVKAEKGAAIVALSLSPAVDKVSWADEDGAAGVLIL